MTRAAAEPFVVGMVGIVEEYRRRRFAAVRRLTWCHAGPSPKREGGGQGKATHGQGKRSRAGGINGGRFFGAV